MTEEKIEIPEDLGVKIGTPEEAAWEAIKKGSLREIDNFRRGIIINEAIVKTAEEEIAKELERQKKSDL